MVLPVNEANIAAAPRANQMNVATRSTQVGIYTISRLSAPGSRVIVQAGPAQIRRVQNLSGKQTSIWAADLARPAEVHFSTRLQAQQLFASALQLLRRVKWTSPRLFTHRFDSLHLGGDANL